MGQKSDLEVVEALERELLKHSTRTSSSKLNALLAEDFFEFGASGRVWSRSEVVESLLSGPATEFEIDSVNARFLAENVVLITYRSRRSGEEGSVATLRSSIWRRRGTNWSLAFHQGTKV